MSAILTNEIHKLSIISKKKSLAKAYALLIFFGFVGSHKFYLNNSYSGKIYLSLAISFFVFLSVTPVASCIYLLLTFLCIKDIITLPAQTRECNIHILEGFL